MLEFLVSMWYPSSTRVRHKYGVIFGMSVLPRFHLLPHFPNDAKVATLTHDDSGW